MAIPGVVYTPREVTAPMVRRALDPLLASSVDVLALRVCDPALGEGAFLLEVIDYLSERAHVPARAIAEACIFGVDIDARAVATACDTIHRATGADLAILAAHLRVADALDFEWPWRFDAVVGNPPYIRQEQLANKPALRGFEVYDGVADLYVYFVELAHRLLRPGGRWCLVLPNKWMTAAYGRPLREYLARQGSVEGLVDLGRSHALFPADAFPCVAWGELGRPEPRPFLAHRASTDSDAAAIDVDGAAHDRERFRGEPWHVDAPDDRALIARLEAAWPSLGELAGKPARGVVTGCNRAFVVDGDTRARLVAADPECAAWLRPLIKGRDLRPLRAEPGDRHLVVVDHGTREVDLPRPIAAHLAAFREVLDPRPPGHHGPWRGRKPGTYAWFELQDPVGPLARSRHPRMFYQDIQTAPACGLDPTGELVPDTTVWVLPSSDPVILAVLNSRLYAWYARRRFPPALNGAVRPKLAYIRALPIPRPPQDIRIRLDDAIDRADLPALDAAVLDAYELTPAERRTVSRK